MLEDGVPHSVATTFIGFLAGDSRPLITRRTVTGFFLSVPFLTVDALQTDGAVEVPACWTDTFCSIPNLTSDTVRKGASFSIPELAFGTDTSVTGVEYSSSFTKWDFFTNGTCPIHVIWALATIGIHIPLLSILTVGQPGTGEAIPLQGVGTFATATFMVEDFACCTGNTLLSVPVQSGRTLALLSGGVEELTLGTGNLAAGSVPVPAFSARETDVFGSEESVLRTDVDAASLVGNVVARTILAFGAGEEDVVVGEVLSKGSTRAEVEMELMTCPLGSEHDLLLVVVDDEAGDTIHAGIVSRNHNKRSMGESETIVRVVGIATGDDFESGVLEGDVADVDGVDLSDGGDREGDGDAGRVGGGVGDLDFVGGALVLREGHGADFVAVEEEVVGEFVGGVEGGVEGEEDFDFLAADAAGEEAGVDLVVA